MAIVKTGPRINWWVRWDNENLTWAISRGETRMGSKRIQRDAVSTAITMIRNKRDLAELNVCYKETGAIRYKNTYPKKTDPKSSKG